MLGAVLTPGTDIGTGKKKSKEELWLSQIITRLNELFITDGLTDKDLINCLRSVTDKVRENKRVMDQIENNSREQALLGDFGQACEEAFMDSGEAFENQKFQYLGNSQLAKTYHDIIFDMLTAKSA